MQLAACAILARSTKSPRRSFTASAFRANKLAIVPLLNLLVRAAISGRQSSANPRRIADLIQRTSGLANLIQCTSGAKQVASGLHASVRCVPADIYFESRFGDLPLLIASIETDDGRDIAAQSPARGSRHYLQDRGAKLGRIECGVLFVDEPGKPRSSNASISSARSATR